MIKAIILDVDGILIGEKHGYNFPHPNNDVLRALKKVRQRGIPVTLCTAKPHFSVRDIIEGAHLNNVHITDGGAVLIDPVDNIIVDQLTIEKSVVKKIVTTLMQHHIYTELYTVANYFMQED